VVNFAKKIAVENRDVKSWVFVEEEMILMSVHFRLISAPDRKFAQLAKKPIEKSRGIICSPIKNAKGKKG